MAANATAMDDATLMARFDMVTPWAMVAPRRP
jgi:hypothetical protein